MPSLPPRSTLTQAHLRHHAALAAGADTQSITLTLGDQTSSPLAVAGYLQESTQEQDADGRWVHTTTLTLSLPATSLPAWASAPHSLTEQADLTLPDGRVFRVTSAHSRLGIMFLSARYCRL